MNEIINRIETAIQFLKDGQSFSVGDLRLGVIDDSTLFVTGWSQYIYLENLTKKQAIAELDQIKNLFAEMVEISKDLRDFIQGKSIKYNLAFNYGMGSIGICSENGGILKWEAEIKS